MPEIVYGVKYVAEKIGEREYCRFAQRPDWLSEKEWLPVAELISRSVQTTLKRSKAAHAALTNLPSLKILE